MKFFKKNKNVKLDYTGGQVSPNRRQPSGKIKAESLVLNNVKRKNLISSVQDAQRNASVAAWMIRHHLDYVASFKFQFSTGIDEKNKEFSEYVKSIFDWHAKPANFDVARRLGREDAFRLFECESVVAGDAAMVKTGAPYKLQMVESDLIVFPKNGSMRFAEKSYNRINYTLLKDVNKSTGCVHEKSGAIKEFCICNRGFDGNTYAFDHLEKWNNVIFTAYYTRFSSQARGISPLSSAINTIQDLHEGFEYNLAKQKIHALFGIALMRDYAGNGDDDVVAEGSGLETTTIETDEAAGSDDATSEITTSLQQMTPRQMMMIDMNTSGKIDTIESKTPSTEYINGCYLTIQLALKALDIPLSAFDSKKSSFSAQIADYNLYEKSCRNKKKKNLYAREEYSNWVVDWAWFHPRWQLAKKAAQVGLTIDDVKNKIEWISDGTPWLQKLQEINGDVTAISAGLDNHIDAARRRGGNVFENIDKIAQVKDYAKQQGVDLMIGSSGQRSIEEIAEAPELENEEEGNEDDNE